LAIALVRLPSFFSFFTFAPAAVSSVIAAWTELRSSASERCAYQTSIVPICANSAIAFR